MPLQHRLPPLNVSAQLRPACLSVGWLVFRWKAEAAATFDVDEGEKKASSSTDWIGIGAEVEEQLSSFAPW